MLLCVAMMLTLLPTMALAASADKVYEEVTALDASDEYVIVIGGKALSTDYITVSSGGHGSDKKLKVGDITITGGKITKPDAKFVWTYNSTSGIFTSSDSNNLHYSSSGSCLKADAKDNDRWTYSSGALTSTTAGFGGSSTTLKLSYDSSNVVAVVASNAKTVTLYKLQRAKVTTPPTAATGLTYNGDSQQLVTAAGAASNGAMKFAVVKKTGFTTVAPSTSAENTWYAYDADEIKQTDAGDYDVYYYAVGDTNYQDSAVAGPVAVTINKKALTIVPVDQTVYVDEEVNKEELVKSLFTLDGAVGDDEVTIDYANENVTFKVNGETKNNVGLVVAAIETDAAHGYSVELRMDNANAFTAGANTTKGNYTLAKKANDSDFSDAATLTVEEVVYGAPMTKYAVDCGTGVTANQKTTFAGNTVTLTVAEGYENPVVTDASGKSVTVTEANGKFTFQMPASAVTVSVSKAAEVVVDDAVCTDCADVDVEAWYHDGIHYCLENGLMKGVSDDTFVPSATTNRAMMWTILARIGGEEVDATGAQWYLPGQEWAVANGISDGTNMTADITREQFATMLYRYAQSKGQGFTGSWMFQLDFTDASSISDWANEAMHWYAMKGILNGKGANNLDPQGALTRAEAAAMIQRYCQLDK